MAVDLAQPAILEPRAPRRYDVDALRVGAVLLLIYFHTACLFMVWPFHIQNLQRSVAASVFVAVLGLWHMPLFFVLAGTSTWLALDFRTGGQYLAERVRRLLLPALFGMLVVIPPQVYIERISSWVPTRMSPRNFQGSFWAFYPHYFEGSYPEGNLSWHHLWFIVYLFVYSVVMLPVLSWLKHRPGGRRFLQRSCDFFSPGRRVFLLAVPAILLILTLGARFPVTHALVGDWYAHANFLLLFCYGILFAADERLVASVVRNRRAALAAAFALTLLLFLPGGLRRLDGALGSVVRGATAGLCGTCWLIFVLGYGRRWLNRPLPGLRYAARIAYPFYILHQTVIIAIAYYVLRWNSGIGPKYVIISTAALGVTLGLCELVRRTPVTRFMFGMPAGCGTSSAGRAPNRDEMTPPGTPGGPGRSTCVT